MLGIGLSTDGGDSWQATTLPGTYEIADITFHPAMASVVWAGTMSGPIKSDDGGRTWSHKRLGFPSVSDSMYSAPIEVVHFDPRDAKRLLAFGGSSRRWSGPGTPLWGAIWESKDKGESWTRLSTLPAEGKGANIIAAQWAGKRLYALVDNKGFFVSEDRGKTWRAQNSGLRHLVVERLAVHPQDPLTAWISLSNHRDGDSGPFVPGGVYKTTDGGRTWKDSSQGLGQSATDNPNFTARYHGLAVSPANPSLLYVSDTAWNTGVTYISRNGGSTWTPSATRQNIGHEGIAPGLEKAHRPEIAVFAGLGSVVIEASPKEPGTAFSINSEFILRTKDGGKTWQDASSVVLSGGLSRGRGYTGWCATNAEFDPWTKNRLIVQSLDAGRAWLTEDGGKAWRYGEGFSTPWYAGQDVAWAKGGKAWAAYGQFSNFQGLGRSEDGGRTWKVIMGGDHGLPNEGAPVDPTSVEVDPDNPDRVWVAIGGRLYAASDGVKFSLLEPGSSATDLLFERGTLYVGGGHGVSALGPDGKWTNLGGPKPAHRIARDKEGRIFATSWRTDVGGVWMLAAGKWTRLLDDPFAYDIAICPSDPSRLAVTTHQDPYVDVNPARGIWLSSDRGRTWELANTGLGMRRGSVVAFDPFDTEKMIFGSVGRGYWTARWPSSLKGTGTRQYASTPKDAEHARPLDPVEAALPMGRNLDLEAGGNPPASWDQKWVGRGTLTVETDTMTAREGKSSLRVTLAGDSAGQISQALEGTAGNRFRLTAWIKVEGSAKVSFGVQSFRQDWTVVGNEQAGFIQGPSDWVKVEKTIELPANTSRFFLGLYCEGTRRVWLDGVSIGKP
jgi:photosystem II stability/assembly factor-like uncharacterized protein